MATSAADAVGAILVVAGVYLLIGVAWGLLVAGVALLAWSWNATTSKRKDG